MCGIQGSHLASCSTEEGATSACVSKCPGHCLIQIRDSESLSRRKGGRAGEKEERGETKEGRNEGKNESREAGGQTEGGTE